MEVSRACVIYNFDQIGLFSGGLLRGSTLELTFIKAAFASSLYTSTSSWPLPSINIGLLQTLSFYGNGTARLGDLVHEDSVSKATILACMTLAAMRVGLCTAISTSPEWSGFLPPPSPS